MVVRQVFANGARTGAITKDGDVVFRVCTSLRMPIEIHQKQILKLEHRTIVI